MIYGIIIKIIRRIEVTLKSLAEIRDLRIFHFEFKRIKMKVKLTLDRFFGRIQTDSAKKYICKQVFCMIRNKSSVKTREGLERK